MTPITLTRIETSFLTATAREGGTLVLPPAMKPAARERLTGRLLRDGLIAGDDAANGYRLTPAGYKAIGLKAPRSKRATTGIDPVASNGPAAAAPIITKKALLTELLQRGEGGACRS